MRKGGETQDRSSEITRENAVAKWRKRIEDDKDRPSSSLGEPAEMGTGLFATFIDLIVAVLTPIVIIVTIGLYLEIAKVPTNDPDGNWIIIFFPMIPLVWILHGWLLTGLKGQTLGKMMCRIKVVDIAGENPGLWAALLRETIGKAVVGLRVLQVLYSSDIFELRNISSWNWHDEFVGTMVIKANRGRVP